MSMAVQKQDRIGYFVRVGTTATADTPTRFVADKDRPPPKKRRWLLREP